MILRISHTSAKHGTGALRIEGSSDPLWWARACQGKDPIGSSFLGTHMADMSVSAEAASSEIYHPTLLP